MYWPGYEPDAEKIAAWKAWLAARPPKVRAVAERFDPWTMYRHTVTHQRCQIQSFSEPKDLNEPVTVTAYVEHAAMGPIMGHGVFGIPPENLVPWVEGDENRWQEDRP